MIEPAGLLRCKTTFAHNFPVLMIAQQLLTIFESLLMKIKRDCFISFKAEIAAADENK